MSRLLGIPHRWPVTLFPNLPAEAPRPTIYVTIYTNFTFAALGFVTSISGLQQGAVIGIAAGVMLVTEPAAAISAEPGYVTTFCSPVANRL